MKSVTCGPAIHSISVRQSEFLAGLSNTTLRQLLEAAKVRHVAPNKNVIVRGERPDHLFLLKKGRVRSYVITESGCELVLLWLVPGGILGLVTLLASPPSYMVSATAVTACDFLVWDHATIRKLAEASPMIAENGFRLALRYLAGYMRRHANIVTRSAESRLARRLIQLATSAGEVKHSGITIDITNEQLSSLSDIGYFTTSRILSKWEQDGKLLKQRGRVTLLAPESLMAA